jgi:hypothetical protein
VNNGHDDALARLRQAVHDLEDQINRTPEQARPAVWDALDGVMGIGYAIHAVNHVTEDIRNITRQAGGQEKSSPAT